MIKDVAKTFSAIIAGVALTVSIYSFASKKSEEIFNLKIQLQQSKIEHLDQRVKNLENLKSLIRELENKDLIGNSIVNNLEKEIEKIHKEIHAVKGWIFKLSKGLPLTMINVE